MLELLLPGVGGWGLLPAHQLGPGGHPPLQGHGPHTTRCTQQRYSVNKECPQSPKRFLNFVLYFQTKLGQTLHVRFMIRWRREQFQSRCLSGVVTRFCSLNGSWSELDLTLNSTCFNPGGGAGQHHHHSVPLLIYFVGVLCNRVTLPAGKPNEFNNLKCYLY